MAVRNKTHSGAKKRFRRTANGFKRGQANHRHLFAGKSMKGKRKLRSKAAVHEHNVDAVERMLTGQ